jgi:O-antigen ligase
MPRRDEALALAAAGLVLGAFVMRSASMPTTTRFLAILVLAAPFVALVVGNVRYLLLGVIMLDLAFQWDANLRYDVDAAKIGSLGGINISVTTIALAGLYGMWIYGARTSRSGAPPVAWRAAVPLGLFTALLAASTLYARQPDLAWNEVALTVQMLLLFVYIASTVRSVRDVEFILTMLLIGLVLESVLVILAFTTGESINFAGLNTHNSTYDAQGFRPAGTLGSPNSAGAYLSLLLPIAVAVLLAAMGRRLKILAAVGLALGLYALAVTQSRGAWIALLVALGALFVFAVARKWVSTRTVAVLVVIAIGFGVVAKPVVDARLKRDDRGAAESRIPLMKLARDIIRDNPVLGVGANNFPVVISDYAGPEFSGDFLYAVHNKYLLVWAEDGILALVAYVWFIAAALVCAWLVASRNHLVSPLGLGLGAALVGHLVHMTVDVFRGRPGIQSLVLLAALLAALSTMVRAEEEPERRSMLGRVGSLRGVAWRP